jgi:hypothetical protein
MGRYDLRAAFDKEPAVLAGAVRSVLMTLVLMGLLVIDEKQLAGIALALEVVLTVFVRQSSTPNVTVAQIVNAPPPGAGPIAAAEAAGVDTAKPPAGG